MSHWTDDRIDYLRNHWGKQTATEIGNALGVTKRSVLGKSDRLGLAYLGNHPQGRPAMTKEERRTHAAALERARYQDRKARKLSGAPPEPKVKATPNIQPRIVPIVAPKKRRAPRMAVDLEPSRNLLIGEVSRTTCAYPTSTERAPTHSGVLHRFCGCPVEPGKIFCSGHLALCFPKSTVQEAEAA